MVRFTTVAPVLKNESPCGHVTTEGIFNLHREVSRSQHRGEVGRGAPVEGHTFLMSALKMNK